MQSFKKWVGGFENFVSDKGKVTPGKYKAYGLKRSTNLWKEAKTGICLWMLRFGISPVDSSMQKQKELGLNKDTTLQPAKSEGEKLRE